MGSVITPSRVAQERRSRGNPLGNLTPALLTSQLDQFNLGHLGPAARTWDAIERRDDKIAALKPKRLGALARNGWEVLPLDDTPAAAAHAEALTWTFNHLTAINAVDENERGGLALALRQMGDAIGKRYSIHETLFTPTRTAQGWQLAAELRHAPLWFFENTTGRLRFLESEGALAGVEMAEGEWMASVRAPGLMEACSVLYACKRLPLGDWLNFSELCGIPAVVGFTTSAEDSDAGRAMRDAVAAFGAPMSFVIYGATENKIEFLRSEGGTGALPFPPLIERCDRAMSTLWRGADLSTMSAGSGAGDGASLQGDESALLEADDTEWAGEILQANIARRVIAWKFGPEVEPLAYIKIKCRQTRDTRLDLDVTTRLVEWGVPVARDATAERFGVPLAKDTDAILTKPVAVPAPFAALANERQADATNARAGMRRYMAAAKAQVAGALSADLAPLRDEIAALIALPNEKFAAGLAAFRAKGTAIFKAITAGGETETALAAALAPALLDGLSTKTKTP